MTYSIEPTDRWQVGDRAYCLRGLKVDGRYVVEAGRMYRVAAVEHPRGMMNDGLNLEGVETDPAKGMWSSRFVCIRGRELPIRQLEYRTSRSWHEAYCACRDARSALDTAVSPLPAAPEERL